MITKLLQNLSTLQKYKYQTSRDSGRPKYITILFNVLPKQIHKQIKQININMNFVGGKFRTAHRRVTVR
jgi:hypothetical protein